MRKIGIATQVFIGLGFGLLVGAFFGENAGFPTIAGDAFIAAAADHGDPLSDDWPTLPQVRVRQGDPQQQREGGVSRCQPSGGPEQGRAHLVSKIDGDAPRGAATLTFGLLNASRREIINREIFGAKPVPAASPKIFFS
jgi:hypothetical protein